MNTRFLEKTIYIDLDSTLFDYVEAYTRRHYKETNQLIQINEEQLKQYHFNELFGILDKDKYKYLDEDFFIEMPMFSDGATAINQLKKDGYKIYFVSHLVTTQAFKGKAERLGLEFDWFKFDEHLIGMRDKHLLTPAIIIDDNPIVLEKCSENGFTTIKYKQPWNEQIETVHEINSWAEIISIIRMIERTQNV